MSRAHHSDILFLPITRVFCYELRFDYPRYVQYAHKVMDELRIPWVSRIAVNPAMLCKMLSWIMNKEIGI